MSNPGENPWLAKLEQSELHLALDDRATELFSRVAADPDENVLVTLACAHGALNRGFLVLTNQWLHWLQKMPKRHVFWSLAEPLTLKGHGTSRMLVLGSGDQFQPGSAFSIGKLVKFYDYYGMLQRAIAWEDGQARQPAPQPSPASPSASIPDQIAQLASLRDQGIISSEDFEAKKVQLLDRM